MIRRTLTALLVLAVAAPAVAQEAELKPTLADMYRKDATRLLDAARKDGKVYERLRHLCDSIGHRLTGSLGHHKAALWCRDTMKADGLDNPRLEGVMAPVWVRGDESANIVEPRLIPLHMLGLGNSVGTPAAGVRAEVVVVNNLEDLKTLGEGAKGKIVLFNHPMPKFNPETGATGYGPTVMYRVVGPSRAAAAGAAAVLVRSVTAKSLQTPHTGMLRYSSDLPQIPAAAVSIENAEMIARMTTAGTKVVVELKMEARFLADAPSPNVVAELTGSEKPDEVVVIGGHLDSWDVGQGAHDDGGGSMMAWEAVRLIKALGLKPRRTIRVVLYTNEENGLRGGAGYVSLHKDEMPNHVAAIESDSGSFKPLGFTTPKAKDDAGKKRRAILDDIATLLKGVGAGSITDGGGGADIGKMAPHGVPQIGLRVEMEKYFDYHHTHADTFDKVDRDDIELGAGVMAVMVYVLADMPERLRD